MKSMEYKPKLKKIHIINRNSYNPNPKPSSKLLPGPSLYIPQSHILKDPSISYSTNLNMNSKYKDKMEDVALTISPFKQTSYDRKHHLFAIFDGHGSDESALISKRQYPSILLQCLKDNPIKIEECLKRSFIFLDHEAYIHKSISFGNTATIVYLANKMLYCANVGDSKCVVITGAHKVIQMSYEDSCDDPAERKRIESCGGYIMENRLNGVLAVTRAIGDFELKGKGLISVPHIKKHLIEPDDLYCVIGSDGIWDVVDDDTLIEIMNECKNEKEFSKRLIDFAIENESTDNLSCIVIKFFKEENSI